MIIEEGDGQIIMDGDYHGTTATCHLGNTKLQEPPMVTMLIRRVLSKAARAAVSELVQQIEGIVEQDRGLVRPASPSADTEPPTRPPREAAWVGDCLSGDGDAVAATLRRIAGGHEEVP